MIIQKPFNVFIDESVQNRHGQDALAVTGYVASFEQWIELEKQWTKILAHYKIPGPFHMTDFIARKDKFANDWPDEKRNKFIGRLAETAEQYTIAGIGCCILRSDYEAGLPPDLVARWGDPYFFLTFSFLSVLLGAPKRYPLPFPKPLYCLFDRKKGFVEGASRVFYSMKDAKHDPNGMLGDMAFGAKDDYIPLQAADLLVYATARQMVESEHTPEGKMFKTLEVLNRRRHLHIPFLNARHFKLYAEHVREADVANPP